MLVPMFLSLLLQLGMIVPVTSRLNSVQLIAFREWKRVQDGQVLCALDPSNETMSASLKDCTLSCGRDATCEGINIKNSLTCDVYTYQPKIAALVTACTYLQVGSISNFPT